MSSNATRLLRRSLLTAVVIVVAGCGVSPKPKAAQALACSKDKITYENADQYGNTIIITGCGKKDILYPDQNKWASLRERAAFEMSCGAGELELSVIESSVFGVTGCGHRIVYKWSNLVGLVVQTASDSPAAAAPEPAPAPAPTPVAPEPTAAAPTAAPPPPATPAPAAAKTKSKK